MKSKKWVAALIILFPSAFWLILETSTINSKKLPYYGTKKVNAANDTLFYKVNDNFDTSLTKFPIYAIMFIAEKYRSDEYRMAGLWEYLNYKKEKVVNIPFVLAAENSSVYEELKKIDEHQNAHFFIWNKPDFDSLAKTYFVEKPYYIDYSFFVLVDANRNIRGYYDARYVAELKRLIEEYQHLHIKEEKQKMINDNEIKSN